MNRKQQTPAQAVSFQAGEAAYRKFGWQSYPLSLVISAGVLLAYLLLLTKNYYWDGIFFAQTIEDAQYLDPQLLHPNHLIYNVVGYLFYRAARGLGLQVRAVEVLQILNCFVGALCAYVFFRILLDCLKSVYLSAVLTLLFAFSATWWKFSTDADSYTLSVLFLLISFYLILPHRKPKPYLLAAMHALSMCFHQLAVLFFPVILLGILLQASGEPAKRRLSLVVQYSLTAFLITFPLFYYSFYLVTGSFAFKPFLTWITNFSPEHGFTFNFWDNLTYTLRGHSRLFVGGRIAFLRDLKSPFIFAMTGVTLILALLFFFKLFRHFRELKTALSRALKSEGKFKSLRLLTLVWIACYVIFLFFFIPQNTFYRLFYLPAIIVLLGTFLAPEEAAPNHVRRYRAAVFVALVMTANLAYSAYPYSLVQANPPLALSLEMNKAWPQSTIIYFATWNSDNSLVRYFNPQTVWREVRPETLEKEIQGLQGGASIWMDTTLIDLYQSTPEGRTWLETHTVRRPEYELVNSKYKLQFYQLRSESF
jgi:transmembrane protein TMEM260 (protein O-mannosyltransferase)